MLPEDLKNYHPSERDSFALFDDDSTAGLLLLGGMVLLILFPELWPWIAR